MMVFGKEMGVNVCGYGPGGRRCGGWRRGAVGSGCCARSSTSCTRAVAAAEEAHWRHSAARHPCLRFNYRGVGQSGGLPWAFAELALDGDAVMRAVLQRAWDDTRDGGYVKTADPARWHGLAPLCRAPAPPDAQPDPACSVQASVLLHGHSMGGAVAARVRAAHPGGVLIHDRSFAALADVPIAWAKQVGATESLPSWLECAPAPPTRLERRDWEITGITGITDEQDGLERPSLRPPGRRGFPRRGHGVGTGGGEDGPDLPQAR